MKFFLLTDDADSLIGMRLAGIEGKYVTDRETALSQIEIAAKSDVGILLMTPGVSALCRDMLVELKKRNRPLIVTIPDSDPGHNPADSVTDYIRDAIGVKI
ncbi:MAG: V-type ATP synthase subunit F [Oscillospiraceae bacterium]|nr:V-type ATP synthase subunit F [Oscillospiraceae bacterium]